MSHNTGHVARIMQKYPKSEDGWEFMCALAIGRHAAAKLAPFLCFSLMLSQIFRNPRFWLR